MKSPRLIRWLVILLAAGALIAGSGYAAYKGYRSWRQARLVSQAREYIAKGEDRKAHLALQRALSINSRDTEAARLMGNLAEAAGSATALVWRQRAVESAPDSTEDRLALVQTAALLQDFPLATNQLARIPETDRNTINYHNVAGGLASLMGQIARAESHFLEALRIAPTNPLVQLNLAVLRLGSTNQQTRQQARAGLEIVTQSTNDVLRCRALRDLVRFHLRAQDTNAALTLARRLIKDPGSEFKDRLIELDILGSGNSPEFKALHSATRDLAASTIESRALMISWEATRLNPADTLAWMEGMPAESRTNASIAMMGADLRVRLKDWRGLQAALEGQTWGDMDFVRLAYRTLALRGQNLTAAADAEWGQTLKAASSSTANMIMLLRAVAQWRWSPQMREVLSMIVSRAPNERWAVDLLAQNLHSEGQTRPLLALFRQRLSNNPKDLVARNNVAIMAMLLEAQELKPFDLALEVYQASPTNSAFVSTYAYSLHLQQRNTEALELFAKLPKADLEDPAIAGYYGLVLKAAGNASQARHFLDAASKGSLLPEEKRLFDRARSGG